MYRFTESIRLLDGRFENLHYHEERMSRTLHAHHASLSPFRLEKFLNETEVPAKGLYKCRIVYDNLHRDVAFTPYVPKGISKIKLVKADGISYAFKYEDRGAIDRLFAQRGACDDVLIVRNEKITDCSFSNIVFRKGRKTCVLLTPSNLSMPCCNLKALKLKYRRLFFSFREWFVYF